MFRTPEDHSKFLLSADIPSVGDDADPTPDAQRDLNTSSTVFKNPVNAGSFLSRKFGYSGFSTHICLRVPHSKQYNVLGGYTSPQ